MFTPTGFLTEPRQIPNPLYEKGLFARKLIELGLTREFTRRVMNKLGESFTLEELRASLQAEQFRLPDGMAQEDQDAAQGIWMLARSNYEVQFQPEQQLSERIFSQPRLRNAMASRTRGSFVSRTKTALTSTTRPSPPTTARSSCRSWWRPLISCYFRFITLNGPAAQNKGMALFPRKINGLYAMLSRQDNENIYLMFSDNVHFWNEHASAPQARRFPGSWSRSETVDPPSRPMPAGWC